MSLKYRKPDMISIVGGVMVRCKSCGERGWANRAVVGRHKYTIEQCGRCKKRGSVNQ